MLFALFLHQLEVAPQRRVWIAPGGGLEAGELPRDAAIREVREETGQDIDPGDPVWTREHVFDFQGRPVRQLETFFLARTERFAPSTADLEGIERRWFRGFRWWEIEAIQRSGDRFAPGRLGAFLEELVRNGPPKVPIDVGV